MKEHFGKHFSYLPLLKFGVPYNPVPHAAD
jgi:hypothetical protein